MKRLLIRGDGTGRLIYLPTLPIALMLCMYHMQKSKTSHD